MWRRGCNNVRNCLLNHIIAPNLLEVKDNSFNDLRKLVLDDYVYECSILPHYGASDFVFLFDRNIQKFLPVTQCFANISDADIKWIPKNYRENNRYCWITVCMLDRLRHVMFKFPIQQAVPQNNDLSSWPCVIRDTKRIGYKVMTKIDTSLLVRIEKALLNKVNI